VSSETLVFMVNAAGCVCVCPCSSVACVKDSTSMLCSALLQLFYPSLCSGAGVEVEEVPSGRGHN